MTKKFVLVFLMVLGFSFAASASLSADISADLEQVQNSGILTGGDSISGESLASGVDGGGTEVAYNKHRKHRRRRGNVRRGRNHRRGRGHVGRGHRRGGRGHHGGRRHQKSYVCYSESYYTGQQFWGSDYNLHHAKWLANDACYKFNSDCYIIGCY